MEPNELIITLTAWILSAVSIFTGVFLLITKWSAPKDKKANK